MSDETTSPYRAFKDKICDFARGQHGIRNPFVIVAVDPEVEHRTANRLASWATGGSADAEATEGPEGMETTEEGETPEKPEIPDGVTVQPIWLDELLARTDVYNLSVDLGESLAELEARDGVPAGERIEETMQDRLAEELVGEMLADEISEADAGSQSHVVLLLNLGSLYPFTRASELLDELDRRNVKSTVGIPFPGNVVSGKLNFFDDDDSRRYYPAHQIGEGPVEEVHLQR